MAVAISMGLQCNGLRHTTDIWIFIAIDSECISSSHKSMPSVSCAYTLNELVQLTVMPQIFSLMHPRDLLNLARTSKPLRALLMSRQSAPFWKAARQLVEGLPDCPPYLSEPEYANLAFFSHCHVSRILGSECVRR